MPELYNIDEIPDVTFPLSFKIIDRYQQEDPLLFGKINSSSYQKGYFRRGRNSIKLVTYKIKYSFHRNSRILVGMVPHVSPSLRTGSNRGDDSPKFVRDRH